mgnify:CR=1 FL=1
MKHFFLRLSIGLAALAVPVTTAAAPGTVSGIRAAIEADGKVHVSWDKPEGGEEPITYRLYYSGVSILENQGQYDDYEATESAATEYIFETIPPTYQWLFVTVLAMDATGEMSPYFLEEASVQLGGAQQQQSSAAPLFLPSSAAATTSQAPLFASSSAAISSAPAVTPNGVLRPLSVEALSATGLVIQFSDVITVQQAAARRAFTIIDGSGSQLPVIRLIVLGKQATLHTMPQERGRVYRITIAADAVAGQNVAGQQITLDPSQDPLLFSGHPTGVAFGTTRYGTPGGAQVSSAPTMPQPGGSDISGLQLQGEHQGNAYSVMVTWQPPAGTVLEYLSLIHI